MPSGLVVIAVMLNLGVGLAHAESYRAIDVIDGGTVVGVVRLAGTAPAPQRLVVDKNRVVCNREAIFAETLLVGASGGVENVVAYLDGVRRGKGWAADQYTLDQKGCRFHPHILLVPAAASLGIANNDDILHMIRGDGRKNLPFNIGQPKFNKQFTKRLHHPEIVKITCDIHSWMSAYVVVQDHPYYAVTDENGLFWITDVPAGPYELRFWHETLGEKSAKVTVKPNAETRVDFTLKF